MVQCKIYQQKYVAIIFSILVAKFYWKVHFHWVLHKVFAVIFVKSVIAVKRD